MKALQCRNCAGRLFFDNTRCLNCGADQVYDPATTEMLPAGPERFCANRTTIGCNWGIRQAGTLCVSCALTETIPDLSVPRNTDRWARIEAAKRRLVYTLNRLGLPLADGTAALSFRLMADTSRADGGMTKVLTGHASGEITVNIAEADDDRREKNRVEMGEYYRTLVGHFRHEVGHFYWDVLVERGGRKEAFTEVFGDAAANYSAALKRHYRDGPPQGWESRHVSAYAAAHPWEDFAETWAHYMHIVDGIETATAFGVPDAGTDDPHREVEMGALIRHWVPLTVVMNAMNRSVGQPDFYPFVLSDVIEAKLAFIHDLIRQQRG